MKRRVFTIVLAASAVLVLGGVVAELGVLPRILPRPAGTLKDNPPSTMSQEQLEALLARVGRHLSPQLRARLAEAVLSESARAGFDPLFVLALVAVESSFRVTVSSDRGAYGLMQLKPATFAWISAREPDIGADEAKVSEDPVLDVRLAVRYFKWLEKRFHRRDVALMAYNAGPRRIQQALRAGDTDRFREYPRRVMREYRRFVRMAGEGSGPEGVLLARAN